MEFHAIILCGQGKALVPFSKARATGTPKALLPVANRPMIEYVLDYCDKAVFPYVTIVCNELEQEEIKHQVEEYEKIRTDRQSKDNRESAEQCPEPRISIFTNNDELTGPILHQLFSESLIKKNHFVVLPCDFITNLPPQVLIEAYRARCATDAGLVVTYKNQLSIDDKKHKIFRKDYTVYTDTEDGQYRLLDYFTNEDVIYNKALNIRTQMSWRYPNSSISCQLLPSGIFFGDVDMIRKTLATEFSESYLRHRPAYKIIRDFARRSWKKGKELETVGLFILPKQATFFRSNNLPVYMEANRYFMQLQAQERHGAPPKDKSIGHDSMVAESTVLGDKTTVKRSVVGKDCKIGSRVKLTGSVVHNGVIIENDVQLENCIIGKNAIIKEKTRLTNCYVESTLEVARGTQAKGETLVTLSLEGIVSGDDDDYAVGMSDSDEYDDDSSSDQESDGELEYGDNSDGLFAY